MKLGLSTDFGSPQHWNRLVAFAAENGVSRLTFWADYSTARFEPPFLYPRYPGLLPEAQQARVERVRTCLRAAAEKTCAAGMEFWYVFQVLQVPRGAELPGLRNAHGELDMSGEAPYRIIRDQLAELFALEPRIAGIELWVMECADVVIADLKHQALSTGQICSRIVDTVHECLAGTGRHLSVDLHTSAGDTTTLEGLLAAAARHPDIIVSGDNVIGDFNLHLPFNARLVHAAETNPIQVHFDLNGEYWGRNFVPTSALGQYAAHIEEARRLGAVHADGRVSTGHDFWSPYANVLPSRRHTYPQLAALGDADPLPRDLEIPVFDTLGAFNAEFFCRRVLDPGTDPLAAVRGFLQREFGEAALPLAPVFMRLESTLGKIFFMDQGYYVAHSYEQIDWFIPAWALDYHFTAEAGSPFPPPEALARPLVAGFAGWPTPVGQRAAGSEALIREKEAGLAEAEEMLAQVKSLAGGLRPEDRDFIVRQFEDLVFIARGYRYLLEAQVHYYLLQGKHTRGSLPNAARMKECLAAAAGVATAWEARYPAGRYGLAEMLRDRSKVIAGA